MLMLAILAPTIRLSPLTISIRGLPSKSSIRKNPLLVTPDTVVGSFARRTQYALPPAVTVFWYDIPGAIMICSWESCSRPSGEYSPVDES